MNLKETDQIVKKAKTKVYQIIADLIIEQLKAANDLNFNQLWDFWFSYGVSLDFKAKEENIYLN
jgi:hypothetical protein